MSKNRRLVVLFAACLSTGVVSPARAQDSADVKAEQPLRIDIPVRLEAANVVLNIDHLAFAGDMPFAIGHLGLFAKHFAEWNTKGHIIAIFHTDAGQDDKAYNAARNIATGNPYKELLVGLMKQGVQIELCGATATAHNWVNADLLPGVKVNTDAMVRLTQLAEEGYVQIKE